MKAPQDNQVRLIKAQASAYKVWKAYGFPHPREVPLEDLAMDRDVFVTEGELKGAEGRLIRKKSNGVITIRSSIRFAGRKRFTLAHELGHWEMHDGCSQFICNERDMRDYGSSPLEYEANGFAAELLMPTKHFRPQCQKDDLSWETIEQLAEEFLTTLTATAIRCAQVSKHKLAIVWHENGYVKWCYSDQRRNVPYVRVGMPVPQYSSAASSERESPPRIDHYDQADWYPELSWGKEGILEATKWMPRLDAGLTLLWLPQ